LRIIVSVMADSVFLWIVLISDMYLQPYVPAYDTVPTFQVADWIADTINTRNAVTVHPACLDAIRSIQHKLIQYKNEPEEYMKGELRKFQIFYNFKSIVYDTIEVFHMKS